MLPPPIRPGRKLSRSPAGLEHSQLFSTAYPVVRERCSRRRGGRHFYGHGTYSADGEMLFTTENDFEAGMGAVGVWDVSAGYARIGELASGGVGPHDMRLLPGGQTLVVANGGIETHPESGRSKLNLSGMRPNLCYLEIDGRIADVIELDSEFHRNSIRHLAVGRDATVAFAMQWQGDAARHPPLLGVRKPGGTARLLAAPSDDHIRLQGYAGSIAIAGDGSTITITSPRGGVLQVFDAGSESYLGQLQIADVCGVSPSGPGFVFTSGTGLVAGLIGLSQTWRSRHNCSWDNHLVPVRNRGSSV